MDMPQRVSFSPSLARKQMPLLCAGRTCRTKPALKLKAQDCSTALVAGKGKAQEASFYLRGKKVGSDAKPPIRVGLHHASSGEKLEAVAMSLDGRKVSLTQKLRGC